MEVHESNTMYGVGGSVFRETSSRFLESASELYEQVVFKTDSVFNEPAPEYWVSFLIGGVSYD
jgi:hypothetical protein